MFYMGSKVGGHKMDSTKIPGTHMQAASWLGRELARVVRERVHEILDVSELSLYWLLMRPS